MAPPTFFFLRTLLTVFSCSQLLWSCSNNTPGEQTNIIKEGHIDSSNRYVNRTIGMQLEIPRDWEYLSFDEIEDIKSRSESRLNLDLNGDETALVGAIQKEGGAKFTVAYLWKEDFDPDDIQRYPLNVLRITDSILNANDLAPSISIDTIRLSGQEAIHGTIEFNGSRNEERIIDVYFLNSQQCLLILSILFYSKDSRRQLHEIISGITMT